MLLLLVLGHGRRGPVIESCTGKAVPGLVFFLDLLHLRAQQLHHGCALQLALARSFEMHAPRWRRAEEQRGSGLLQWEEEELDESGVGDDGPPEGLLHALKCGNFRPTCRKVRD